MVTISPEPATESIGVRNPRTGVIDHHLHASSRAQIATLAERARAASEAWSGDLAARIAALRAWRTALLAADDLRAALVVDTGRTAESHLELELVCRLIDRWCDAAPGLQADVPARPSATEPVQIATERVPYPLVGVISPWNFPLLLSLIDTVPALLAGSTVLLKPSEMAPRFLGPLARTIAVVPGLDRVLVLIPGGPAAGAAVVESVDALCFTGSVATGRRVALRCAERFIPAFLELGGKDPAIVTAGADVERAARALVWGGTVNAGQSCLSIERVYAEDAIFEPLVARMVEIARGVGLAYPEPDSGPIGPIIADRQIEVLRRHLADAYQRGARALCGGELQILGGGTYLPPTILVDVDHDMLVMREETFGPIVPVARVGNADEAVALANDSCYGLGAAVFADTPDAGRAIAARLRAGAVSIDDAALTALVHDAEKDSFGLSGLGPSRMGSRGMTRFWRHRALLHNPSCTPDPWWF